jgi:hypothetical protein
MEFRVVSQIVNGFPVATVQNARSGSNSKILAKIVALNQEAKSHKSSEFGPSLKRDRLPMFLMHGLGSFRTRSPNEPGSSDCKTAASQSVLIERSD